MPGPFDDLDFEAEEELNEVPDADDSAPAPARAKGPASRVDAATPDRSWLSILADAGRAAMGDAGSSERLSGLGTRIDRDVTDAAIGSSEGTTGRYRGDEAGAAGALQALTLEHGDELGAAMRGQDVDEVRREMAQSEEQNPSASMVGRAGGGLLLGTMVPGAASGAGLLGRLAVAGAQGAGFGALAAHGASDADTAEERLDAMPGGALSGGLTGLAFAGGAEALGAGVRGAREMARGADRQRVASVATGRGGSISDGMMREAEAMPGGISGVAERIRRLELVGPASTSADVLQRASEATQRLGSEGELGRTLSELNERGAVPRQRILDALVQYAEELGQDPNRAHLADSVLERAAQYERVMPPELPWTGERSAQRALSDLGQMTNWTNPATGQVSAPREVQQGTYSAFRRALDDLAEQSFSSDGTIGPPTREAAASGQRALEAYRGNRLDWQTADFARRHAEETLNRLAMNRGVSPSDMLAMMIGNGGPTERLMNLFLNRGLRYREGAMRASLGDLLAGGGGARLSEQAEPHLRQMLGAMGRGGAEDMGAEAAAPPAGTYTGGGQGDWADGLDFELDEELEQ